MAQVTFTGVTKRYGDVLAVDRLDLAVEDGEFMVLLGPSGCGKSTALRMIAGLEEISDGELTIGDRVVNHVPPARRDVSMVFQSYALYPHMTVAKNVESPLLSKPTRVDGEEAERKLSSAERQERVTEAARMLGLEDYLGRKPGALSGGQRQRVAVARAVVSRPAVYLMDEPLSNLDAKLRAQTRAELIDLHARLRTTIVYVTHDQVEAMTMADRVAIMADGRLQQIGTPREVYERPATLFVAGFIGTPPMNTAPGTLVAGRVEIGSGSDTVVGVRPEHLTIEPGGPLRGTVHHVEWLGHEALVTVDLDAAESESAPRWVVRLGTGTPAPGAGAEIGLSVAPGATHVFAAGTGVRTDDTSESAAPDGVISGPSSPDDLASESAI